MQSRIRKGLRTYLDRRGFRTLLGFIATIGSRSAPSGVERIYYEDGLWIHRYPDGYVVDRRINARHSLSAFDKATRETWEYCYEPVEGDVVIDVGAGIGTEVQHFSKAVGSSGFVVAIEAQPDTFKCLCRFCELNHLDNVSVHNLAISDTPGSVQIDDNSHHISSTILGGQGCVEVKADTLDNLLDDLSVESVDYLKMNIEGAERLAIRGMTGSIARIKTLNISCHDFKAERGGAISGVQETR